MSVVNVTDHTGNPGDRYTLIGIYEIVAYQTGGAK